MDCSIIFVTPAMHRARGARYFDKGLGLDDHGMPPEAPTVADYKTGWLARQYEIEVKANGRQLQDCPP
jgi:hypothetical protein